MTIEHKQRGVHVSGGSGMVAHLGKLTAYATGDEAQVNALIVQLNALADAPWQEVVRTLTSGITEVGYDLHPHVACVSTEQNRVAAFVFGDTSLMVVMDGKETVLDGRDSSTWIDVAFRGRLDRVLGGTQGESALVGVLRDGVVPAGGFMLDSEGPIPAAGRWRAESAALAAPAIPEPQTVAIDSEPEPLPEEPAVAETPEPEPAPVASEPSHEGPSYDELAPSEFVAEEDPDLGGGVPTRPIPESAPPSGHPAMPAPAVTDVPQPERTHPGAQYDSPHAVVEPVDPPDVPSMALDAELAPTEEVGTAAATGLFARIDERINSVDELEMPVPPVVAAELFAEPEAQEVFAEPEAQEAFVPAMPFHEEVAADSLAPSAPLAPAPESVPHDPTPSFATNRPQIRGVRCPEGHLTSPLSSGCRTCGLRIDPAAPHETGDRPTLGTLTFDDGAVLAIDRPAAIGSDVPTGYEIEGEAATIVRLDDGIGGVSPVQVEVRISGWECEIVDMHSANGTYTTLGGERQTRTKLRSGQSTTMQPGMKIETGGRSFIFAFGPTPLPSS